jgi:hypothetical protein
VAEDGRDHRPAVPASPPRHRSQRTACRTTQRRHCCRVRRHGSRPGAWCHQAQTLPDPTPPCEDDFNILHRRCRPSGIIIAPPFPAQHGRPRPAPLLVNSPRILTRAVFSASRPQDAYHGQTAYDPTLRVGRVVHVVHLNTLPMSTTLPDRPCRIDLAGLNRWLLYRMLFVPISAFRVFRSFTMRDWDRPGWHRHPRPGSDR